MSDSPPADSRTAEAALTEAMQLHQHGDLAAADQLYTAALRIDPGNAQALRLQGILARENGDIENSLSLLERAARAAPDQAAPLNELALSKMVAGNLADAQHALRTALEFDPVNVTALTNLGALLQHRGHIRAAIRCYADLLEQQPDDVDVRCNLAKALVDVGDAEAALRACDLAIHGSQNHPYTLAIKGAVLTDLERYDEAKSLLKSATEQIPDDDMALVNLALCLDELKETDVAVSVLQQSLEVNPFNARAVADMANCLVKLNETEPAIRLCQDFLAQHPGECLVLGSYALALAAAGEAELAADLTSYEKLAKTFWLDSFTNNGNSKTINEALARQIQTDSSLLMNPISKSTSGGAQTGELNLQTTAEFAELGNFFESCVRSAAEEYRAENAASHPVVTAASDDWSLRCWGTLLDRGGQQTAHMHPLGWLSGVYYAQIPDLANETDQHAGSLLFGPPPARFSQNEISATYHQPIAGQLVLFPSWFWHQTVPFESNAQRISIAFDIVPRTALRML